MGQTAATPSPAILLELAARDYRVAGSLERAVADELGLSATRFWQLVAAVIAAPPTDVAVEWAPTIRRLRARVDARARQRRAA